MFIKQIHSYNNTHIIQYFDDNDSILCFLKHILKKKNFLINSLANRIDKETMF